MRGVIGFFDANFNFSVLKEFFWYQKSRVNYFFASDTDTELSTWNFRELWDFSPDSQSKISEIRPFVGLTKIAGRGQAPQFLVNAVKIP